MTRLIRNIDFACRDDDGAILVAFPQTDLRSAHVVARRIAGDLKNGMFTAHDEITTNVTLATLKSGDTLDSLMQRVMGSRMVAAESSGGLGSSHGASHAQQPTGPHRRRLRRSLPVVLHRQAPPGSSDQAQAQHRGRGALAAYFLNDWIPRGGISREEYLTTKFGSVERYGPIAQRVTAAAAAEGLTYASDKVKRQPNTLDCHRLIRWAGEKGKAAEMKQTLMDFYFTQGADLTNRETLVKAAADVGLDADTVRTGLASDKDVAAVEQEALSAKEAGIEGVPCFIFGGKFAVSGAQAPEYLADAIERMANAEAAE